MYVRHLTKTPRFIPTQNASISSFVWLKFYILDNKRDKKDSEPNDNKYSPHKMRLQIIRDCSFDLLPYTTFW